MRRFPVFSFPSTSFGRVHFVRESYPDTGRCAVELFDEHDESLIMLSINIPELAHDLGANEFYAKTYSENEELARDALASGHFTDTGRRSRDFLQAPIWRITPEKYFEQNK